MHDVKRIHLSYRRLPGVFPRISHGVFGGVTDGDTVEMEFFSESQEHPDTQEICFDDEGRLVPEEPEAEEPPVKVVRTIHSRILMGRETARNVARWLEEVLEAMDAADRGPEEDPFKDVDESLMAPKRGRRGG